MADFTLFVGILRAMKTSHFVSIFKNPDGRLHFVRRHQKKLPTSFQFFQTRMADFTLFVGILYHPFRIIRDGRRFAPASRGYENKTATHRALRALVFLIHSLRARNKFRLS
jgi:hypothetical protein